MQLLVKHRLPDKLVLPLNYQHILQAIIYKNLNCSIEYSKFLHDNGFPYGKRNFKLFTFSLLRGKYEIVERKIIFRDEVSFEIRSPDVFMMKLLSENIMRIGIKYGDTHITDVEVLLNDYTIESDEICINMLTPVSVYSTGLNDRKTYFYNPSETEFCDLINENFIRKYAACFGVPPQSGIFIEPVRVTEKDKYVTKYKNFYISGWLGKYNLYGRRKYLDFLYQTGLGSKNAQGFGMFSVLEED